MRAECDPEFRDGLFVEAIEALLGNDFEIGKVLLRDYVDTTMGFKILAREMHSDPKSLKHILSAKSNPRAENLFSLVAHLKQREGLTVSMKSDNGFHP